MKCFILKLYGKINYFRRLLYRKGIFKSVKSKKFIISIGNITMGGSGKTPFSIYLAKLLESEGLNVVVLTRGYGRKKRGVTVIKNSYSNFSWDDVGDEPLLLSKSLKNIPVVVSKDRVEGLNIIEKENFTAEVFILDDGFQYLKLRRDIDIVLVDATNPFFYDENIGCKLIREPVESLNSADILVITKLNMANKNKELENLIVDFKNPIFNADIKINGIYDFKNVKIDKFSPVSVNLISAIGNNFQFEKLVKSLGIDINKKYFFRDHYIYKKEEIENIIKDRGEDEFFLTTEKDFVKLLEIVPEEFRNIFYYLKIEIDVKDEEKLKKYILDRLKTVKSNNKKF